MNWKITCWVFDVVCVGQYCQNIPERLVISLIPPVIFAKILSGIKIGGLIMRWCAYFFRIVAVLTALIVIALSGRPIAVAGSSRPTASLYPTAFTGSVQPLEHVELTVPEPIDLQVVRVEDELREQECGPYRFAISRPVLVTPETHGTWEEIQDGIWLWRLHITSSNAISLNLAFTCYLMPPHGNMFIYSADYNQVLGPFTIEHNQEHKQLWTPLIYADDIIIEVTLPLSEVSDLELELTSINHGYRFLAENLFLMAAGDSAWCHRDVSCPEGDSWRDQIRSVAMYTIGGTVQGTGTLLNNTTEDDKPYFLTAFHVFDPDRNGIIEDPQGQSASLVLYWNYEASECRGTCGLPSDVQHGGAHFRAGYCRSDFVLVELAESSPSSFNVYFAGWDRTDVVPAAGVAIHHPQGDCKKINVENDSLKLDRWTTDENPCPVPGGPPLPWWWPREKTHLQVSNWDVGATETGSSGCPLFNSEKGVVGQLQGGTMGCSWPRESYFGRLFTSWTGGGTSDTRLSDWLDPLDSGVMCLDGKKSRRDKTCKTITIGTGASSGMFPMYRVDSRTQVIYLASEIGNSGTITALALDVTDIPSWTLNNWTIRMKHTTMSEYSTCLLEPNDATWTVVYQNYERINNTGWKNFELQTPFEYNGIDNLLVDFIHSNSSMVNSGWCSYTRASRARCMEASSGVEGDPRNWSGTTSPDVYCSEDVPNIKLTICEDSVPIYITKLLASDGTRNDYFGHSVSINSDYAIIGAPYDDDKGDGSGSAYIFKRDGSRSSWTQQAKLTSSDGASGDTFGYSVSISGYYAIIGASGDDSDRGSSYIFERDGSIWMQRQKLIASDAASSDYFGHSVSISGDYAIVGAYGDDSERGSSYIFKRDNSIWRQQQKLTASDGASGDYFGYSVSISGDYAIMGAYGHDDKGTDYGSAYIFKREGSSWRQQAKLSAKPTASDGGVSYDWWFGRSVSISGDYAIVGARNSAYIFKGDGSRWTEQVKLEALDGLFGDHFGDSSSMRGDYIVIGAYGDSDKGTNSGSAYIFKRGCSGWTQKTKLIPDVAARDEFGTSVSMSGDYAVIGAPGDDTRDSSSGSAYVFFIGE